MGSSSSMTGEVGFPGVELGAIRGGASTSACHAPSGARTSNSGAGSGHRQVGPQAGTLTTGTSTELEPWPYDDGGPPVFATTRVRVSRALAENVPDRGLLDLVEGFLDLHPDTMQSVD